jgi:hypothetical protein
MQNRLKGKHHLFLKRGKPCAGYRIPYTVSLMVSRFLDNPLIIIIYKVDIHVYQSLTSENHGRKLVSQGIKSRMKLKI